MYGVCPTIERAIVRNNLLTTQSPLHNFEVIQLLAGASNRTIVTYFADLN